jgi:hypothetical protein
MRPPSAHSTWPVIAAAIGGQVGDGGSGVVGCEPPLERLAVDCGVELLVGVHGAGARQ